MQIRGMGMGTKERWAQTCNAYVKENPLVALGMAAAVGFLVSRLIR